MSQNGGQAAQVFEGCPISLIDGQICRSVAIQGAKNNQYVTSGPDMPGETLDEYDPRFVAITMDL